MNGIPREELISTIKHLKQELGELKQLVRETREAQRFYFKDLSPQWLRKARELEKALDAAVDPQPQENLS